MVLQRGDKIHNHLEHNIKIQILNRRQGQKKWWLQKWLNNESMWCDLVTSWHFSISIKFRSPKKNPVLIFDFCFRPKLPYYVEMKEVTEENTFFRRQTISVSSFQLPLFSTNKIKLWIWSRWKTQSLTRRDLWPSNLMAYEFFSSYELWLLGSAPPAATHTELLLCTSLCSGHSA